MNIHPSLSTHLELYLDTYQIHLKFHPRQSLAGYRNNHLNQQLHLLLYPDMNQDRLKFHPHRYPCLNLNSLHNQQILLLMCLDNYLNGPQHHLYLSQLHLL